MSYCGWCPQSLNHELEECTPCTAAAAAMPRLFCRKLNYLLQAHNMALNMASYEVMSGTKMS